MNTYFLAASRDIIFASKKTLIENQATIISTSLSAFDSLTVEGVSQVMGLPNIASNMDVTITGINRTVLYDTTNKNDAAIANFVTKNIESAFEGNDVFYSNFSNGVFSSSVFTPIMRQGVITGVVYVHEYDSEQGAILVSLQKTIKNISIIIASISIIIIAFIISTIMRRITAILTAIQSVREGEYNYKIEMKGNDELTLMGDEFNSLTDRLRETEEIRRRFVADASHELKTPLASIRLLTDSILQNGNMDSDTIFEFVSDIGSEAERLTRTTEKLMSLARLDSEVANKRTLVDIKAVITKTLRMLNPLASQHRIEIVSDIEDDCFVLATEDDIYQVVFNLVENAIKYNMPGGRVSIRLARDGDTIVLTVEDTGIGIPPDDLPYIFDRFYRVDKARSREAGGSGLGLSIVWDTARRHGGSISAERRDEGGMRFKVSFPPYVPPETAEINEQSAPRL